MRCVQQINESHLKNEPLTPSQLGSQGELRSMTNQEVILEYKRLIMMNFRRYHPLLWISHRRFSNVNSSMHLPKLISCTLMISWIIIAITMTLALYQIVSDPACQLKPSSAPCHSQPKILGVDILFLPITVISAFISTLLTYITTRNFFEFLDASKNPSAEQSLQVRSDEIESRQEVSMTQQKSFMLSVQRLRKKSSEMSNGTPGNLLSAQLVSNLLPRSQNLYPIKEDDEEQPLSPEKMQLDDIGCDEVGPGRPQNARDGLSILPPLGMMRSIHNDYSNVSITNHMKNHPTASNGHNDIRGINNSRITSAEHNDNTQQRTKSMSNSQISIQGNDDIIIEDAKEDNFSSNNTGRGNQSKPSIKQSDHSNRSSSRFDPGALHPKTAPTISQFQRTLSGVGPSGPTEPSTNTMEGIFVTKNSQFPNFYPNTQGNDTISKSPISRDKEMEIYQGSRVISMSYINFQNTLKVEPQNKVFRFASLAIGAIILVGLTLSPLFVVHHLSTLQTNDLKFVLLSFIYALLFDCVIIRLLLIASFSLCHVKYRLNKQHYLTIATPKGISLEEEQLNLLGEFYEDYQQLALITEDTDIQSGYETNAPQKMVLASLEDEVDIEGGDQRFIRSAESNYRSQRPLIKLMKEQQKVIQRVHATRCADIFLVELQYPETHLQRALVKEEALIPTPQQNNGRMSNTSNRLVLNNKLSHAIPTVGNDAYSGNVFSAPPDDDEEGLTLKILRPPSSVRHNAEIEYQNNLDDDIEIIEIGSGSKKERLGRYNAAIGIAQTANPTLEAHNPSMTLSRASSTHHLDATPSQILPPVNARQQQAQLYQFETPKPEIDKENSHFGDLRKSVKNLSLGQQLDQLIEKSPTKRNKESAADHNVNEIDKKKQLLRDLILEGSASTAKKEKLKREGSKEEYRSLKKYLDEESHQQLDSRGNVAASLEKQTILNDSDIAALWNAHPDKQSDFRALKSNHQFSPKYTSGNKSASKNQQLQSHDFNLLINKSNTKQKENIGDDGGSLLRNPLKDSFKGTISNGYSGAEEVVGSFRKDGGPRSSSHHTNLLRSVLSQNRDQENCDFSDIIKQTPRDINGRKSGMGKGFNSPQAKEKKDNHLESSFSKKKKYASIIVQPERPSTLRDQYNQNQPYDDVRILEEEDNTRTGEDLGQENIGSPHAGFGNIDPQSNGHISIIQFYNDSERMPKHNQIEHLLQQKTLRASQIDADQSQPQNRPSKINTPIISQGSTPKSSDADQKQKIPSLGSGRRNIKQDSFRQREKSVRRVKEDLAEIMEADEFGIRVSKQGNSFIKVHPDAPQPRQTEPSKIHAWQQQKNNKVLPVKFDEAGEIIIEEGSMDMKNETPTPSPEKVKKKSRKQSRKKARNFMVVRDNQLVGEVPNEAPEVTALRRSKLNSGQGTGNQSLRPLSIDELSSTDGGQATIIETNSKQHRRYNSNARPIQINQQQRDAPSNQSSNRAPQGLKKKMFQPSFANSVEADVAPKQKEPPPVYNLHLKAQEEEKRKQNEIEVNMIRMQDQYRQLKKFLQLSRQLRKGKDEKKIKELMGSMKDSGKPLPLQMINELRMLEIMSSPYSQPLMGMIKQIEIDLTKKQDKQDRPGTTASKFKQQKFSRASDRSSQVTSTRVLNQAMGVYGQDQQQQSNLMSSTISGLSKSRESSQESHNNEIKPNQMFTKSKAPSESSPAKKSTALSRRRQSPVIDISDQVQENLEEYEDVYVREPSSSSFEEKVRQQHFSSDSNDLKKKVRQSKKAPSDKKSQGSDRSAMVKQKRLIPSQYSSINQVLIEHELEESVIEISQRKPRKYEDDLEMSGDQTQVIEIEDDIDSSSMEI